MTKENKFTIGSQWRTRCGWRAVVVDIEGELLRVWHDKFDSNIWHKIDGRIYGGIDKDYDLIEPWKEPRTGEVLVSIGIDGGVKGWEAGDCFGGTISDGDVVARVKVNWTEGQFDD